MTAPRYIVPGTTYLVTRRCSERRFFLRPSPIVNGIFLFVLAMAARLYKVQVHAFCVLSNHYHLLVTDPHGRLPDFMQYLDGLVALAVNAALGHHEGLWASERSYSAVSHCDDEDMVQKAAYVLANPVAAGLVRTADQWPGLWTSPSQVGGARFVAPRPTVFFSPKGSLPTSAELVLTPPPGFASVAEFQARVAAAANALEEEAHRRLGPNGFLGASRIRQQNPFSHPRSSVPRRALDPRIAGRDKVKRLDAIRRLRDFVDAYRRAWKAWRDGDHGVVFPFGTYRLRVRFGVACAAPD